MFTISPLYAAVLVHWPRLYSADFGFQVLSLVDVVAIERVATPVPRWVRNTVLTVSEVEAENGWGQCPEGRVYSCVLVWVENLIAHRTLAQPESDGDPERVMGEDKVGWDNVENSW